MTNYIYYNDSDFHLIMNILEKYNSNISIDIYKIKNGISVNIDNLNFCIKYIHNKEFNKYSKHIITESKNFKNIDEFFNSNFNTIYSISMINYENFYSIIICYIIKIQENFKIICVDLNNRRFLLKKTNDHFFLMDKAIMTNFMSEDKINVKEYPELVLMKLFFENNYDFKHFLDNSAKNNIIYDLILLIKDNKIINNYF